MKRTKSNDYTWGIEKANTTIPSLSPKQIAEYHDNADSQMYKSLNSMTKYSKRSEEYKHFSSNYWANRGLATAFGFYHHNGKFFKK